MTIVQKVYLSEVCSLDNIEKTHGYLSATSLMGSQEIRDYLSGKPTNFGHVRELSRILDKYSRELAGVLEKCQSQGSGKPSQIWGSGPVFPYRALWYALIKNSGKSIKQLPELVIEMKLLMRELNDVLANHKTFVEREKLEDLEYFLDRCMCTEFCKDFFVRTDLD